MTKIRRPNDLPSDVSKQYEGPSWSYGKGDSYKPARKIDYDIDPPVFGASQFRTVGLLGIKLIGLNPKRRIFTFQNLSANNIWIGVGDVPTYNAVNGVGTGFLVPSNGALEWDKHCPVNDIYAVSDGAGSACIFMEGLYNEHI